ncbi:hypothetical protein [Caldanaerobius polysaccharolyticus]|uniref:hypothetical protein n=1 Tax=Caldanaerobius polysaccharolyticus TaxID=44256 RepID=UPI00047AE34A|nr:hypothetical protein [Caldanaerobius polysaccharolyticus]
MDLTEYCELKHICPPDHTNDSINITINEVNKLLENGWVLIETFKTCYDEKFTNIQKVHFILGYPTQRRALEKISGESYDELMKEALSDFK